MTRLLFGIMTAVGLVACGGTRGSASPVSQGQTLGANDPGSVSILIEPGDDGGSLISAITAAQQSIHVTMYMLTDYAIQDALIARANAGVDVKIILNEQFPSGTNSNDKPYAYFQDAGVNVVWAPSTYTYTHEKTMVFDGQAAWIMTMNSSLSSVQNNREYLAVDTRPADVAEAEAQFAADFAGNPYTPDGPLLVSPVTSRPNLSALVSSATQSLDFEVEEFSDPDLAQAMCAAEANGVTIRGLLSNQPMSNPARAALSQLQSCGIPMAQLAVPYLHAKAVVVDGTRAFIGSENFTAQSLDGNRELGVIFDDPSSVATVAQTIASDLAAGTSL
jgi:phosphatidylserine/phosphatidylglycerophosphate/cardiolipin synthase-like enzyme